MTTKRRVCILLLDSLGVGASLDAAAYGDVGVNTLGSIVKFCQSNYRPLNIPNLAKLGIYHVLTASAGESFCDLAQIGAPKNIFGYAVETSLGKDTISGHWELAGLPVDFSWALFPDKAKCFPASLLKAVQNKFLLPGFLGEKHASGTDIIAELGSEHILTQKPIIYTSADSVIQIAAHEESFGLSKLHEICEYIRAIAHDYVDGVLGRVIARPFKGDTATNFARTANRRDFAISPPHKTLLDILKEAGREVYAIGKISDIFAGHGVTHKIKADGNQELFDATLKTLANAQDGSLIFTNFVDFDSLYGHRRDVLGYANALETLDARLPALIEQLRPDDLVIIAADHGCDPTYHGSDHTREHIPVLAFGPKIANKFIGRRDSFADIGQSIAQYLSIPSLQHGVSFL
jgi:phosphopentomutase